MTVIRTPYWIPITTTDKVFSWIHSSDLQSKNHAFIIIGPIGPEYMHTFRAQRLLADKIAELGYIAIRYDHSGMGDSTSTIKDSSIWDNWLNTPNIIKEFIISEYKVDTFSLIALRSGSLLLERYINSTNDNNIIFWFPYTIGAAFVRDMKMLDGLLKAPSDNDSTVINGGGYPLTPELQNNLNAVNILKNPYTKFKSALIIENGEISNTSHLSRHLENQGINIDTQFLHGLKSMARQSELSIVPQGNINYICKWIKSNSRSAHLGITRTIDCNPLDTDDYQEDLFFIKAKQPIFGILTLPKIAVKPYKLLILTNSGSGHHVGPNRFHVDTARSLAKKGVASLRLDLSNLGESPLSFIEDSYHPYPKTAASNLEEVLQYFNSHEDYSEIILCGLCSGAHNAFHAALITSSVKLRALILINIITFYWKDGQSIISPEDNALEINVLSYQKNIFSAKKWMGIVSSPSKIPRLFLFLVKLTTSNALRVLRRTSSLIGRQATSKLDDDLKYIISNGVKIHFIYSENEPTYNILLSQAATVAPMEIRAGNIKTKIIKNADHTFSSINSRKALISSIINTTNDILSSENQNKQT